ncbi:MAG TPA: hypothetical protein VJR92_12395 [Gemmatimonadaceae bacterium]|nr:hypothetical protein [Gemmatimonadaceae bacterium]
MPDRLPSLIVLVGFWIPPALAGVAAAARMRGNAAAPTAPKAMYAVLASFVLGYSALWFLFNLTAIPPYIPGSTMDPTYAPPHAAAWLAAITSVLVLPGSAVACALGYRWVRKHELAKSH